MCAVLTLYSLLYLYMCRTGVRLVGSSALGVRSLDESERVRLSGAIGGMCAPVAGAPTLWRMHGVRLACRSLKSLVLALAVLDAHLSGTQLERVVQLASLEQEFQVL